MNLLVLREYTTFPLSTIRGELQSVQMAVRAAGKKQVFEFDMAENSADNLKWETKTWEFTAVDTITVLEFHTAMAPTVNAFGGPLLDDVKVVAKD